MVAMNGVPILEIRSREDSATESMMHRDVPVRAAKLVAAQIASPQV